MTKHDIDGYVGKRLKQRRTIMGLSQESVAKAVGITFQQVQKYEKGSNAMNARRLYEFARFMNVPVAYFFEGIDQNITVHNVVSGFAETPAAQFDHDNKASDRESLEMMKSFKRIKEPVVRKRLADLLRAVADNKTLVD
ncbi:MAG: helix-turn-helix transcriptional regulator [Pseudomonadota bacterium]